MRDPLPWTPAALAGRTSGPYGVSRSRWRPEIQALRALAVALVVAATCGRPALPGGFVGVDVFFAISGFLITSLLLRELDAHRAASRCRAFWARRARRILPAALLTLLVLRGRDGRCSCR